MAIPDSLYFMSDIIKEIHYIIKIQKKKFKFIAMQVIEELKL